MDDEPPLDDWEREVPLRELARIARGLGADDYARDIRPRLARLTIPQRALIVAAINDTIDQARERGDFGTPPAV